MRSLKSYQNLRRNLRKQQQSDIFGEIQINREPGHLMKRAENPVTVGSSSREMVNVANSKCSEQNDIGTGVLSHVGSISGGVSIIVNNFNVESSDVNDVKQHLRLLR